VPEIFMNGQRFKPCITVAYKITLSKTICLQNKNKKSVFPKIQTYTSCFFSKSAVLAINLPKIKEAKASS
jgi:hypothetical protein